MSAVSTSGIVVPARSRALREAVEVISSMRFAIALLSVICIASVIGTVVRQGEPYPNYVNQFGPFWARVFDAAGLYTVYSAWWFLLILTFLVTSTSLCIARNLPKIRHDVGTFKEHVRASSLKAFHHRAQGELALSREAAIARVDELLKAGGWAARAQSRGAVEGHASGVMVAARQGMANKLGYLCAHGAIVLVCIGGLLDGNLIVRAQMAFAGKVPYQGSGAVSSVAPEHVLSPSNPTYRGNLFVAEGQSSSTAVIQLGDGIVLQPLPFDIELKKFIVDYYDTGMPKLFASEVLIRDHATGQTTPATIKVNEPAIVHGVAIYQSSFDDGGSRLELKSWPLVPNAPSAELKGEVGASQPLQLPDGPATLELTGLRVINVENLGAAAQGGTDVRKVDLVQSLESHLGSGAKTRTEKTLTNVGPSISYKLRDAAGQAREFNNYMLPLTLDGQRVFLAGVRDNPNEGFRYLRIPADEQDSLDGWMRLRAALLDPSQRAEAVRRYVKMAAPADRPELVQQLTVSAGRALALFAGAEPARKDAQPVGGLQAIADFLDANVPQTDRARTSDVLIRILNGSLFELVNLTRERAGLAALPTDDKTQAFMGQAVISLSDSLLYPAPVLLMPTGFDQRQASVFQVTRAPGKNLVYAGCALLILGVFAMLYIRERRLWIWLEDAGEGRTQVTTALSCTRQTLDTDREFEQWKQALLGPAAEGSKDASR